MKLSKPVAITVVVLIIVIGLIVALGVKKEPKIQSQKLVPTAQSNSLSPTISPKVSPNEASVVPSKSSTPSVYSAAVKAKVRSDFINSCNTKAHYSVEACGCAADYLAKNYTEVELAKMYVEYHASNQVTSIMEAAINSCTKK